jgi:hypothetical protein
MPFEVKGYIPSVPPGAYQATCVSVEERSPKADPDNVFRVWEFQLTDGSLRTVDGSSSLSTSPKSKAGKWLAAMGITPVEGQMVEPEGKACTIVVAIKETTGYEYVETVAPPAPQATSSVPAAVPVAATGDDDLPF